MAKHMKESAAASTAVMDARRTRRPATRVEARSAAPASTTDGVATLPYGREASYRTVSAGVPTDDYYGDELPARGGLRALGRGLLLLCAWAFRLCAWSSCLLTVLNALMLSFMRGPLTRLTDLITSYLPWAGFDPLGIDTPFGGTLRIDFAVATLLFFVVDWLLCRVRRALR